jgi:hypothetical protein
MPNNMEKMREILEQKKAKQKFLQEEKKVGSGRVEKMNKNKGNGRTRTKL